VTDVRGQLDLTRVTNNKTAIMVSHKKTDIDRSAVFTTMSLVWRKL
jgi:hypothetical protein